MTQLYRTHGVSCKRSGHELSASRTPDDVSQTERLRIPTTTAVAVIGVPQPLVATMIDPTESGKLTANAIARNVISRAESVRLAATTF